MQNRTFVIAKLNSFSTLPYFLITNVILVASRNVLQLKSAVKPSTKGSLGPNILTAIRGIITKNYNKKTEINNMLFQ